MDTVKVENFADLHAELLYFMADKGWIFRGHGDSSWPLLPKAGREPYCHVSSQQVFEAWKRRAIEYVTTPMADDWDWLAVAQHDGLATRLLDWCLNPLNAAFFALRDEINCEASIIAVKPRHIVRAELQKAVEVKMVKLFRPRAVVSRIVRQGGVFTVHPDPLEELLPSHSDLTGFKRILVPAESRSAILAQLAYYGVNHATLFPDLDGLSAYVNWSIASGQFFR
jgi:hypothetical protein